MNWREELQLWLTSEAIFDVGLALIAKLAIILLILILARGILHFGYILSKKLLKPKGEKGYLAERKAETLRGLVNSILRYIVYFWAGVTVLDTLRVPITSVLAGAGIVGLAVGFGAQNLVTDVLTGFFIIFEDQYAVGEYIKIGEFSGIVEEIGLRTTKIRAFAGDLHILPNGNVNEVTNYSRGNMRALVDIAIAYEEDVEKALGVLRDVSQRLADEMPEIVEGPHVLGVVDLGDSHLVLRIIAMARPMHQWAVEREMRRRVKEEFTARGIETPYPRRLVILAQGEGDWQAGGEKNGKASI